MIASAGLRFVRWAAVFSLLAAGCSLRQDDNGGPQDERIGPQRDVVLTVAGDERVYDLYVPLTHWDAATPSPLVVLLHGNRSGRSDLDGTSRGASPYSVWQDVAEAENIVLLIPQGVDGPNGHAGWNDCRRDAAGNPGSDDVAFIAAAIDMVNTTHRVDEERVYVVGTSNGGHMAQRLADEAPDVIAGIGVIAAGVAANSECVSSDVPVSALFMWGTDDPIAPFAGGQMASDRGEILSAAASIERWVDRNDTVGVADVMEFPNVDDGDASTARLELYTGGAGGARVALYRIEGGGHTEPSVDEQYSRLFEWLVGRQNHDIEMAIEVWRFFEGVG